MLFYPADPSPDKYLRLRPDGVLEAAYSWRPDPVITGELVRIMRRLGGWTVAQLAQHPAPGNGIHYAGTLPMRAEPGRHELHADGRLEGTTRVYVTDGSGFPRLPAKNLTYTIMANALRIAEGVRKGLG
jgi:choline dehydrogenase-like flavoprotein